MPEVGLRELKTRASEILRDVRDRRARYTITYRGRPVGVLLPIAEAPHEHPENGDAWAELMRQGQKIAEKWQSPLSSAELLSELRR